MTAGVLKNGSTTTMRYIPLLIARNRPALSVPDVVKQQQAFGLTRACQRLIIVITASLKLLSSTIVAQIV